MDTRETVVAKLSEWGITLSDAELDQLLPAYENLLRWQAVLEAMVAWEGIGGDMVKPTSEPILIQTLEKKG